MASPWYHHHLLAAFLALATTTTPSLFANAALTTVGADWSSVAVEEASGITYTDTSGNAASLESLLASSGVDTVRQRVWTGSGDYDLSYNLDLASRATSAGMDVYLTLHLSDTWADPGDQAIPSGWPTDSIDDLAYALYNYTMEVCDGFADAGISPSIISIGNEVTNGILFPLGSATDQPYNLARLLHSAAWGIKDSSLASQPKIMIHTDNGWDWDTQEWFWELVLGEGPLLEDDFDVMGVSYYPFYNSAATLSSLSTSLSNMASTWGKEIMVVETDWPTECSSPAYAFPSDLTDIPFSAAGQTTFMQRLADTIESAGATALFYWEPAWVDNAGLGSSCESNCMFAWPGTELSSLDVFGTI